MKIGELQKVWRIVAGIMAGQILGGLLGLLSGLPEGPFIGGPAGSLPGFILGAVWHVRAIGWREKPIALFLGFLALLMTGFILLFFVPRVLRERDAIAEMARLKPDDFRRIEVQVLSESGPPLTLEGEAIEAFTRACADVEKYSPNHPQYQRSWYVVLAGARRREVELHLMASDPSRVFGSFVEKSGATTWYHGSFQSVGLRAWVDRYLLR